MFRKFFAAIVASMLVIGGLFADEVKAVFKKVDGGKITVEVDGKEKTYKVGEKVKVSEKLKDGAKVVLTVDGETVTKVGKDK